MSKVIVKISFKHPNLKDTVSKNVSHVNYIATRSGVDKTLTEIDLAKELEKGVVKLAEALSSDDKTYLKYIDERPRSHGLFGADGIEDPNQIQEEITKVQSYVWRGIVSLREEDAKELGYLNKDKWQDLIRAKMPGVAREMGVNSTNLRWVSAVHMEKGHPHAHVIFWEKEPERTLGVLGSKAVNNIRKLFTDEVFADQKLQILYQKNAMRDLIREQAAQDISSVVKLIKEVNAVGRELKKELGTDTVGIGPRLYNDEEKYLIERIKNLADLMPRKGRVALKFMPQNVKEEVMAIADHLLEQPELGASLAKNLQATEELTKLYTSKEDAVEKARENAYKDIRDRLCQIILKGAAQSQKENNLFVDQEKSIKAVEFIKNLNRQINLVPEQTKVLSEIAIVLDRTGHTDQQISNSLQNYAFSENIYLNQKYFDDLVKQSREKARLVQDVNAFGSSKKLEFYLASLKLAGYDDKEALQCLRQTIEKNAQLLTSRLNELKDIGFLKSNGGEFYQLTNTGIDELLKTKDLDRSEKEIFKVLEIAKEEGGGTLKFDDMLQRKALTENLRDPYPAELRINRFDVRIKELFGEDNQLSLKKLEKDIYDKFTKQDKTDEVKAGKEFDMIKNRLDKLSVNGLTTFDRTTGTYSFTAKGTEALQDVPSGIQFTRYDATVTLGYIDKAQGTLTKDKLQTFIEKSSDPEEVDQDFKNVIRRLDSLKKMGYLEGEVGEYKITITGALKRTDILTPEKELLKDKLHYLERLGLIKNIGEGYGLTERYTKYMKDVATAKEQDQARIGTFPKDIAALLDRTQDRISPERLARVEERQAIEKYINGSYQELKTDYQSLRTAAGVQDSSAKIINNLSTTLMISGLRKEEATSIIQEWNTRNGTVLDPEQLNKIIEKAHNTVEEDRLWGRTTIISVKDWKAMFESLGVDQKDMPKWIYQGENWKAMNQNGGLVSMVNDVWKSAWRVLEQQRLQTQAQAEMMKRRLIKQSAMENKEAMVEQAKKNKAHTLYREDELEL
jgi:DNA-binding PadR family transcriptional regulator